MRFFPMSPNSDSWRNIPITLIWPCAGHLSVIAVYNTLLFILNGLCYTSACERKALAAVITERELAEKERQRLAREQLLRAARLRLAAIVESSDDAIIGKDLDGIITDWNNGAARIYGYAAEQVIGKPISILTPPEKPDEIVQIMERVRRGERIEHYETVRLTRTGKRIQVSLTVSPIRDEVGNIVGASAAARDITERKRAEEERERLVTDLQAALAKVKLLSGFLPICAACKKIRNDQGYWEQVEIYIRNHSEAEFSHAICPDCFREHYPGYAEGQK